MFRKTIGAALLAAFCFSAPVNAADLGGSIKDEPVYTPPPAPIWTGFYVGLNGGYGFAGHDRIGLLTNLGLFVPNAGNFEMDGFFGGGQVGYNMRSGNIVYGFEADIQASDVSDGVGPVAVPALGVGLGLVGKSDVKWFSTVRGRIGLARGPALFYATGGVAFAGIDYSVFVNDGINSSLMKNNDTQVGWTAGAGVEYALDSRWSAKVEYMYVDFGRTSVTGLVSGPVIPVTAVSTQESPNFHAVRAGLNYKLW